MIRKFNRLKMETILLTVAMLATAAVGTTFAWQNWELGITNHLKAHDTVIDIEEKFDEEDPYDHKEVEFINTGSSSAFVRVGYVEYWEMKKNGEAYLLSNQSGENEVAIKNWTKNWNENWTDGQDGWFYYNKILKSGESTDLILNKVELLAPLPEEYWNADYHLYFKVESVQCSDGSNTLNSQEVNAAATKQIFGVSPDEIKEDGTVIW